MPKEHRDDNTFGSWMGFAVKNDLFYWLCFFLFIILTDMKRCAAQHTMVMKWCDLMSNIIRLCGEG